MLVAPLDKNDIDDPRSQLARFDLAPSRRDLAAAADIAGRWNGPAVEGLEIWHQSALSRFALDKALADLQRPSSDGWLMLFRLLWLVVFLILRGKC